MLAGVVTLDLIPLDDHGLVMLFNPLYRRYYDDEQPVRRLRTSFHNWNVVVVVPDDLILSNECLQLLKAFLLSRMVKIANTRITRLTLPIATHESAGV